MSDLALAKQELETEASAMSKALELIKALSITDEKGYAFASEMVKDAKARWKQLDDRRKEITVPLNAALESANALFRPALANLKEAERLLKDRIGRYAALVDSQRVAAMQQSAATYASGGVPTAVIPERPAAQGIAVRTVWQIRVVDEKLVPREFCSPDPYKLAGLAPQTPCPGIEWYQENLVRVGK